METPQSWLGLVSYPGNFSLTNMLLHTHTHTWRTLAGSTSALSGQVISNQSNNYRKCFTDSLAACDFPAEAASMHRELIGITHTQ